MLRLAHKLSTLMVSVEALSQNYANMQSVRYARKPLWMGTAKSKLFKVPKRPVIPAEDKEELKRLFNNYRTEIKSLRRYFTYKYSVLLQAKSDTEQIENAFREDLSRCNGINDEWNAEIRVIRDKRIAENLARDIEYAKNRLEQQTIKEMETEADAEEIVRQIKDMASSFITRENIDEAIEYALNNPVDYNFAIDVDGNKIIGRETKPVQSKDEVQISVKQ